MRMRVYNKLLTARAKLKLLVVNSAKMHFTAFKVSMEHCFHSLGNSNQMRALFSIWNLPAFSRPLKTIWDNQTWLFNWSFSLSFSSFSPLVFTAPAQGGFNFAPPGSNNSISSPGSFNFGGGSVMPQGNAMFTAGVARDLGTIQRRMKKAVRRANKR